MGHKKKRASRNGTHGASISPEPSKDGGPKTVLKKGQADGGRTEKANSELDTAILSKFLQADSAAVQERVERIQELLGSETQLTLAQRADLVYNRRPEILELVGDLQQAYLILAKRYDHVAGKVVRLTKTSDSPVFDTPILQPLSATKRRPAGRLESTSNGDRKVGGTGAEMRDVSECTGSASTPSSDVITPTSPESSSLNPDAAPFVATSPSPHLNPEAPPFTPTNSVFSLSTPSSRSTPPSNSASEQEADRGVLGSQVASPGKDVGVDPETPRMSTFRFKDSKGSGSYNVEEEGPLHAGHMYADLVGAGEGPVHAGYATGSWVPESALYATEQALLSPDIQEVVSLEAAGSGGEVDRDAEGGTMQPISAFLCAAQIQEAAGKKQGPKEAAPQLSLRAGLEEGPVHDGHALMIRGASTKFERELRLSRQMADALAVDQEKARKFLDLEYVLQVKEDGNPARLAKQSLLKEMIRQQSGEGSEEEKQQLEKIGHPVQESGEPEQSLSEASELETERLRKEIDELTTQKKEAIRYLTECVDVIRQEKQHVATVVSRMAVENLTLRERLEEVLQGAEVRSRTFWGSWGFGDRQGWEEVIAEALGYGDADVSSRAGWQASGGPGPSGNNTITGRKPGGIVIREPGAETKNGADKAGASSLIDSRNIQASDRKGKGKAVEIEEDVSPRIEEQGRAGKSTVQELREENESLRRALAAINGQGR